MWNLATRLAVAGMVDQADHLVLISSAQAFAACGDLDRANGNALLGRNVFRGWEPRRRASSTPRPAPSPRLLNVEPGKD